MLRCDKRLYGYVYNLQGDVIAIIDSAGTKVVEYKYDAWGRILSKTGSMASTLGTYNPFRYRHHVYDEETQLYYLRSRYYKPETCRFVNADDTSNINDNGPFSGYNIFAYCINSPVVYSDPEGSVWVLGAYAPYYAYYHMLVSKMVVANNPGMSAEKCLAPTRKRVDLLDYNTGEFYEIKPDTVYHIGKGIAQIQDYAKTARILKESYRPGTSLLNFDEIEPQTWGKTRVSVTVRQQDSLILYKLKIDRESTNAKKKRAPAPNPNRSAAGAALMIGLGGLAGGLLGGSIGGGGRLAFFDCRIY